jgi:hypothetical protein
VVEHLLCKQGVAGSNPVISTDVVAGARIPDVLRCKQLVGSELYVAADKLYAFALP